MEMHADTAVTVARSRSKRASAKGRSRPERARYNGRTREAVRVRTLAASFRAQLVRADVVIDPIMSVAITRAAELIMLSELKRAQAIRGEDVDLGDLKGDLAAYLSARYGDQSIEPGDDAAEQTNAGAEQTAAAREAEGAF